MHMVVSDCLTFTKIMIIITILGDSLVAQMVKCLLAMRETRVQSLGREDPLEKEMATYSNILACKIPWMEEPDRLQSMGLQSHTQPSDFTFFLSQYFSPWTTLQILFGL